MVSDEALGSSYRDSRSPLPRETTEHRLVVAESRFLALECPLLKPASRHLPSGCPAARLLAAGRDAGARAPAPPPRVPLPACTEAVQSCPPGASGRMRDRLPRPLSPRRGPGLEGGHCQPSPDLCQLPEQGGGVGCLSQTRSSLASLLSTAKLVRPQTPSLRPLQDTETCLWAQGQRTLSAAWGLCPSSLSQEGKSRAAAGCLLSKQQAPQSSYHLRFLSTFKQVHSH